MYIPAFFSTAANGCPNGYNAYELQHYSIENLNTGARGRQVTNWNKYTNQVVGENYQGLGDWDYAELGNGSTIGVDALRRPYPSLGAAEFPNFGTTGFDILAQYYITGSGGENIVYCYDCTRKYRWTFGSKAGLPAPWQQFATPLGIRVLTNPTGSITNTAHYTITTLNFDYTQTDTVVGYGPLWQYDPQNAAAYYIISREDITPQYYGIQNCATSSLTASISLSGSVTLNVGDVFKSSTSTLSGSCWSVTSSFQSGAFTPNISNVVTSSLFASCDVCEQKYNIVNCQTSESYVAKFSGSVPSIGTVFSSYSLGNGCYTLSSLASANSNVNYINLATSSAYIDCPTCIAALPSSSFVSGANVIYDFGNITSYPGSGSTVFDISGYGINGSLINNPTWSSTNGGQLSLSTGSAQYIEFNTALSSSFTTMAIIKCKQSTWTNLNNGYSGFPCIKATNGVVVTGEVSNVKDVIPIMYYGGTTVIPSGTTIIPASIDTWRAYTFTTNGTNSHIMYLDNNISGSNTNTYTRGNGTVSGALIGHDPEQGAAGYLNGYVMGYLQYNRQLTQAEIDQNFAVFSSRF
jgi:hypothetical protein